jgi:hypothetical protein
MVIVAFLRRIDNMDAFLKPKYNTFFAFDLDQISLTITNNPDFSSMVVLPMIEGSLIQINKYRSDLSRFVANGKYNESEKEWVPRKIELDVNNIFVLINISTCKNLGLLPEHFIFKMYIVNSLYRAILTIKDKKVRDKAMTEFDGGDSYFFMRLY